MNTIQHKDVDCKYTAREPNDWRILFISAYREKKEWGQKNIESNVIYDAAFVYAHATVNKQTNYILFLETPLETSTGIEQIIAVLIGYTRFLLHKKLKR